MFHFREAKDWKQRNQELKLDKSIEQTYNRSILERMLLGELARLFHSQCIHTIHLHTQRIQYYWLKL